MSAYQKLGIAAAFLSLSQATFSQVQTEAPTSKIVITEVVTSEAETQPESVSKVEISAEDEGTNDPVSTGAIRYEVSGKVLYVKQYEKLRIEQIEK